MTQGIHTKDTVEVRADCAFKGEIGVVTSIPFRKGTYGVRFPDGSHAYFGGDEIELSQQKLTPTKGEQC